MAGTDLLTLRSQTTTKRVRLWFGVAGFPAVRSTRRAGERAAQAGGEREAICFVGRVGILGDEMFKDAHELFAHERRG